MVAISRQTVADEIKRQQALTQEIAKAQIAVSSGKKLSTPSDDVYSWVEISEIGRLQASFAAWTGNVSYGASRAEKAQTNLSQINTLMSRARELVLQASSTSTGDAGRATIATELQSLLDSEAWDEAARAVTALDRESSAGVSPYLQDRNLLVSLPIAVRLTLEDYTQVAGALRDNLSSLGKLRVSQATASGDVDTVRLATVQFAGTDAAAEAHAWLGEEHVAASPIEERRLERLR